MLVARNLPKSDNRNGNRIRHRAPRETILVTMSGIASRVALVTGAGSGIGAAVSVGLAAAGFAVVLAGRRVEPLAATAAAIARAGGRAWPMAADVCDEESVRTLFARIGQQYARLDVLFNNAGASHRAAPLEELSREEWQLVLDTNLTGAFLCTQQAFSMMKRQTPRGGRIINNGSISAHTPRPRSAAYTSTKHAVTGLTKSASLDGRAYDIAVGQVDIGNAATPMTDRMVQGVPQPDGRMMPEPRMDAEHVGSAVAYMASLPLDANVLFMTVMATKMPFVGRG